MSNLFNVA